MAKNKSENEQPEADNHQIVLFGGENDGNLAIVFSETDLELYADFNPPAARGTPLDKKAVSVILDKINVIYGVRWENIEKALTECFEKRRPVKNVLIARGDPPRNEVAEYYELNPTLGRNQQTAGDSGKIDYRSRSPFIIVKEGQVVAALHPGRPGREGKNVHGDALPFTAIRTEGVIGGENTRTENGTIISEINGQLVDTKRRLSVQKNLVVKGGVGYRTGNIVFPGDVTIDGQVSDGFKIFAGGSLLMKQTFDVTEVISKGDLTVLGGIIGRGAALVKAGGGIKTKFIENCRAAARKNILVESEITNSSLFTLEKLEMGEKGIIVGGEIYAVHGIKTGTIGKKSGKSTRIHCGIDFTALQEKEKCNNQLRILSAKLGKLRELVAEPEINPGKKTKMEELIKRLEEEEQTVVAKVTELLGKINADENAVVEVLGDIAPGTLIEICQIALFVSEPLHKVRIRLDTSSGKLLQEPLNTGSKK